jgi:hypothetical protein
LLLKCKSYEGNKKPENKKKKKKQIKKKREEQPTWAKTQPTAQQTQNPNRYSLPFLFLFFSFPRLTGGPHSAMSTSSSTSSRQSRRDRVRAVNASPAKSPVIEAIKSFPIGLYK